MSSDVDPIEGLLEAAEAAVVESRQAEFTKLRIARDWVLAHRPPVELVGNLLACHQVGASQVWVRQHVEAELGACLQVSASVALRLMADAVDLERRLPATWAALAELRVEVWVARKIAGATMCLSDEQARWVDGQVAGLLGSMPPGRLLRVVQGRVKEADQELADRIAADRTRQRGVWFAQPDDSDGSENRTVVARLDAAGALRLQATIDQVADLLRAHCPELATETRGQLRARALVMLANPLAILKLLVGAGEHDVPEVVAAAIRDADPARTRPRSTLYLHLSPDTLRCQGVARAEELGALTRAQLVDLLGHEHVTLKPVIDLNAEVAADCYEVPAAVSEQLGLVRPADCFPYGASLSRRQDQDHTRRYQWNGPPGQTRLGNLGRMTRRHHRVKTFAGWRVWQHEGHFTWISPHGRIYLTDARGTHPVDVYTGPATFATMLGLDHALAT